MNITIVVDIIIIILIIGYFKHEYIIHNTESHTLINNNIKIDSIFKEYYIILIIIQQYVVYTIT